MQHTVLCLTEDEIPLFDALPSTLKEGWSVEVVDPCHEELRDWEVRVKNFLPEGPLFDEIRDLATTVDSEKEFEKRMKLLNFKNLDYDHLLKMYFVLGTRLLTAMIRHTLENAKDDEDVEGAMTLSIVRANLFTANGSACVLL